MKITQNSRITFGVHRGTKISELPDKYLEWLSNNLINTGFHDWAIAAKLELKTRINENKTKDDLEKQADDFLRSHGIDPNDL